MEQRYYPQWNETLYRGVCPSGLTVCVVKRPGFTKKLAYFVTDFGSIHTEFTLNGQPFSAPAGVAHFLEHKMFDLPGRDVSEEFAALGAYPNAFTGYDMTAYYFSCTNNFEACLRLLLEFVSTPYFTAESVEKEQGIIGQEIGMSRDNPDHRIFELLVENMYPNHPIRTPILGSRESIGRITPEILHACHRAFYRPDNMLLCVVGDVDPAQVMAIAREMIPEKPTDTVTRTDRWEESMQPVCPMAEEKMEVAMPMFQLGFKCEDAGFGPEAIRQEAIGDLACEALFGESSALYMRLYAIISTGLKNNVGTLLADYGIKNEKLGLVILYHEVMWDIVDLLIEEQGLVIPEIVKDAKANKKQLKNVSFFVEDGLFQ